MDNDFLLIEHDRMLSNIVRIGIVEDVDYKKARAKVKLEEKLAIYQAQSIFTYSGGISSTDGASPYPPAQDPVTLTAKKGKLQEKGKDVLLDGDQAVGTYGNKLEIKSQRKLKLS